MTDVDCKSMCSNSIFKLYYNQLPGKQKFLSVKNESTLILVICRLLAAGHIHLALLDFAIELVDLDINVLKPWLALPFMNHMSHSMCHSMSHSMSHSLI